MCFLSLVAIAGAACLLRAIDGADDFGLAHFEVGGAVGGGLGGDLGVQAAELVPAAAVDAEVREAVGGGVERHFGGR